jgi:hypothetical protein
MKGFQVRVELYGAEYPGDYGPLQDLMEGVGFQRQVMVSGTIRKLPPGEYMFWDEEADADGVLALAKATVTPFWGDFAVVVGECTDLRSSNLKLAGQAVH